MMQRLLTWTSALGGLILLIVEFIRGTNAGIYADAHGTVGRFDFLDGLLMFSGLILLLLAFGIHEKDNLPGWSGKKN